jgi:hypothetical protein
LISLCQGYGPTSGKRLYRFDKNPMAKKIAGRWLGQPTRPRLRQINRFLCALKNIYPVCSAFSAVKGRLHFPG